MTRQRDDRQAAFAFSPARALPRFVPVDVPASRRTDPVTSAIAEDEMRASGKIGAQQSQVLTAVRGRPGATSAELARFAGWDRWMPARRLKELETGGYVRRGERRRCDACGRPSVTWWAVDDR